MRKQSFAVVLSGPSGAGKTSLCHGVVRRASEVHYSVSVTTRARRAHEKEGKDYHFVYRPEFQRRIDAGRFVEWAEVHGNLYGTDRELIDAAIGRGEVVILDLDVRGAALLKAAMPGTVTIFVLAPTWAELEARLRGRRDESEDAVSLRMRNARDETRHADEYDYIVLNEDLDDTIDQVIAIIRSEGQRSSRLVIEGPWGVPMGPQGG